MDQSFAPIAAIKPQKSFAVAFAVLALALAGCASGLGVDAAERGNAGAVAARVQEGAVVAVRATPVADEFAYTVRLDNGELVSIAQVGSPPIANGVSVIVEHGQTARVIPQIPARTIS